jgi:GH24 family phage-related lysozyme (muramidase)
MSTTTGPSLAAAIGALERLWPDLDAAARARVVQSLAPAEWMPAVPGGGAVEMAVRFLRLPGIEGCKLEAYPDPETKGDPWTIGWGNTRINGRPVRRGDRITQAQADEMLRDTVTALETVLAQEVPSWGLMGQGERAALLSFAFNNGAWFMRSGRHQTIERALREGRLLDVPEAMGLYVNPGGPTEAGLRKRRRLEAALWRGGWAAMEQERAAIEGGGVTGIPVTARPSQPAAPAQPRILNAGGFVGPAQEPQHYIQTDSRVPGQALRSCFSSACAMLLKRVRPTALMGSNADDDYLRRVLQFGDTVDAAAQIRALASYGVQARLIQSGTWELLEQQIRRGFGAALGYIHNGPVDAPTGFGHWCYGWGLDATHVIVHDPMGEADMVRGGFVAGRSGRAVRYSRRNFSRRWEVKGPPWRHAPGHGWMVVVDGVSG